MNIAPLLDATLAIQFHVATILPAAILGPVVLLGRKGTPRHKLLGRIWLALMVVSAISTFFIHTIRMIGPFSPIHLLSIVVLVGAFNTIRDARAGRIRAHRRGVLLLYLGGVLGAGIFTLLPGRLMNEVVTDGMTFSGPYPAQSVASLLVVLLLVSLSAAIGLRSLVRGR